jgi:pyruvate-ferredoxin/flavodoxin oxidoreductase
MRLAVDKHDEQAKELLKKLSSALGDTLVTEIVTANQADEAGVAAQRKRIIALREKLKGVSTDLRPRAQHLDALADYLVKKSVWAFGGDGWAYDIGFGGLDHVLASGRNVNILVMDTEVYSNTGGQQSKATPIGAAAKFASAGKTSAKKDLGLIAMSYGNAYVARVAFGAKDTQTVKAFLEADSYEGPSIIIAYSHCIAHGYDLSGGPEQQKLAVETGYWPLYRFDPRRVTAGEAAMQLDSNAPKGHPAQFVKNETRFRMVEQQNADRFKVMMDTAKRDIDARYALYSQLAAVKPANGENGNGH